MAYPKEHEHAEYMRYVEQWSMGDGDYSNEAKMSKEEWRKRKKKDEESDRSKTTTILGAND